ncbi:MAG: 3-phosphoshikimate 1-carboxyvinyltransferase, partial [Lachnospiraceae bacterium]|nr:3-phosphoshikimate 1-carboxyvinyltransferase [Lachnospiraceae bacterium]
IDTGISSQFASALLMSGVLLENGLRLNLLGDRADGAYIRMTIAMMEQFGIPVNRKGNVCEVPHMESFGLEEYQIEPDLSGACYFYAMAPLLKTDVIVKNVHRNSLQGDIKFLEVLQDMGCGLVDQEEGMLVEGSNLTKYPGMDLSMKDFSDQTMTMASLAPFAEGPVLIRNIGHIRHQETDRINAVLTELQRMGIRCEEVPEYDGIRIFPGQVAECEVDTYDDHRMAMAFTLIGLKTGKITIKNPACCKKTFENYFDLIEELCGSLPPKG